jgi:hypothetical protein
MRTMLIPVAVSVTRFVLYAEHFVSSHIQIWSDEKTYRCYV